MTACVCNPDQFPFLCERHQCSKTQHWYKLCRTREDYFRLWEQGNGPGQRSAAEPGLLQKGINFAAAVGRHLANNRRQVPDSVYELRLSICRDCPSLDPERMVCREPGCGCYVERKARWASQACPVGKWKQDEPERTENDRSDPVSEASIEQNNGVVGDPEADVPLHRQAPPSHN